jgi:hypothetical protein
VLTSRVAVADLHRFRNGPAPLVDVEQLSGEAGAELLRDNDVWGVDRDLKAASRNFGGHPLALTLLSSLLKETQNGNVRRRDHIRGLLADAADPRHDQARRVMESYEKNGSPASRSCLRSSISSACSTVRRAAAASRRCAPGLPFGDSPLRLST